MRVGIEFLQDGDGALGVEKCIVEVDVDGERFGDNFSEAVDLLPDVEPGASLDLQSV